MFDYVLVLGFGRIAEVLYIPWLIQLKSKIIICEKDVGRHTYIKKIVPNVEVSDYIPVAPQSYHGIALNLTPVFAHESTNRELLEKGWNVFSEKLAANSSTAWAELLSIAKQNNCTIVSAPVSANQTEEDRMLLDIRNESLGEIVEVHCQFIGGGPARRGFIQVQREWMLKNEDALRVDLAPYLLTPVVKAFGAIKEVIWMSNRYYPDVVVENTDRIIKPEYGSSEVGIGVINHSIATFLVSYRPNVKDVTTKIEIIGTKKGSCYDLSEKVSEGVHSFNRVQAALELLKECIEEERVYQNHQQVVSNVISCIKGE
ncbi:hypothetical protein EC604_08065 [Paenibacillus amylolyticus]|uniref:Gfo/Idh/MocA-like oxidoreductase N-terminal domain-containing protein n=1 Tax=Paenibacillus amylolyticus TaxID=1451 RepID=A0A5M9WQB0_PAEAM|nr:hypothetical protein [Paenibacillus amylolyticus]KAA8783800.1 hypothetical protein EC604_08065 [Paenibacillus amylolyticus]